MQTFQAIFATAAARKGGEQALNGLLPKIRTSQELAAVGDDRFLAMMTRAINQAGFSWTVIQNKWPQFEAAFYQFDIARLSRLTQADWEAYTRDKRVVRNWQKIKAVMDNLSFIRREAETHGSFARFIAAWPSTDQMGLLAYLKKHGARLGGQSGQWFLRYMQKDCFVLTRDVCTALRRAGVEMKEVPSTKGEMKRIQDAFNQWHEQSGLSFTHLSKIAAFSVGTQPQTEQEPIPEELEAHLPKDAVLLKVTDLT